MGPWHRSNPAPPSPWPGADTWCRWKRCSRKSQGRDKEGGRGNGEMGQGGKGVERGAP